MQDLIGVSMQELICLGRREMLVINQARFWDCKFYIYRDLGKKGHRNLAERKAQGSNIILFFSEE